jgi:hypothetical protein
MVLLVLVRSPQDVMFYGFSDPRKKNQFVPILLCIKSIATVSPLSKKLKFYRIRQWCFGTTAYQVGAEIVYGAVSAFFYIFQPAPW